MGEHTMDEPTEFMPDEGETTEKKDVFPLKAIPALDHFQRLYGKSCTGDDKKAVRLFKEFESAEKLKRLKGELISISQNKASDELCAKYLGKTRKSKFGSWAKWAIMMLAQVNSRS